MVSIKCLLAVVLAVCLAEIVDYIELYMVTDVGILYAIRLHLFTKSPGQKKKRRRKKEAAERQRVMEESLDVGEEVLDRYEDRVDTTGVKTQLGRFSALSDMFGRQAQQSYLDSTEGAAFTNLIDQGAKRSTEQLGDSANLMNLTDEAYLSGLNNINRSKARGYGSLVTGADNRRRGLRSQQMAALSQVLGGEQGLMGAQQNRFAGAYGIGGGVYNQALNNEALQRSYEAQNNQNLSGLGSTFLNAAVPFAGDIFSLLEAQGQNRRQ